MSETLREAATFIEQGHVRVGPDTVTDPAFLVTRTFEDFVTWVDTSKVKRKVMRYNDKLDDFGARRSCLAFPRLRLRRSLLHVGPSVPFFSSHRS